MVIQRLLPADALRIRGRHNATNALAALAYEHRIRRLTHWVDLAEREGRRYRLHLPGQPVLGPGQGAAHRHLCLRALALLPHAEIH